MSEKKHGFVLAAKGRVTGALLINELIFKYLKKYINISSIRTKTDFYYQIQGKIGYILNFMTNYQFSDDFDKVIATNVACLPFLQKAQVLCVFHSVDSANQSIILGALKNVRERKQIDKWTNKSKLFEVDVEGLSEDYELLRQTEKFVAHKSCNIIAVSDKVKENLIKEFKIPSKKVKVILNGIDDSWFNPSPPKDKPSLVFSSRVNDQMSNFLIKGVDRVMEIFSKSSFDKKIFLHVGNLSKSKQRHIKNYFSQNALASVAINLSREQLSKEYYQADIFLAASRAEACQLTLIEAMASGMVPVCFGAGIVDKYIRDGKNGFIVKTTEEAIERINLLYQNDQVRLKLSEAAVQTVRDNFRITKMLESYKQEVSKFISS